MKLLEGGIQDVSLGLVEDEDERNRVFRSLQIRTLHHGCDADAVLSEGGRDFAQHAGNIVDDQLEVVFVLSLAAVCDVLAGL